MKTDFVYTGIGVSDLEKSVEFYTRVLGMKVIGRERIKETEGEVVELKSRKDGPSLELNFYRKGTQHDVPYLPGEGLDHLAFRVENLDNAIAEAARAGHPVVAEVKTERSRWVYIRDPDGLYIELM